MHKAAEPFEGVLQDVFQISGRGTVVLIEIKRGVVHIGDSFAIGELQLVAKGIELVNSKTNPTSVGLWVGEFDIETIKPLIGQAIRGCAEVPRQAALFASTSLAVATRTLTKLFADAGLETPELDARWLVIGVLGITEIALINRPNRHLGDAASALTIAANRRLAREPVSRILGNAEFYGREFRLSSATLDPRPDTETLIGVVLKIADAEGGRLRPLRILDLGTGTGCLLLTLLAELPNATGIGCDISAEAIATATQNARQLGVADRCELRVADMLSPGFGGVAGPFDLIISNPPYIETAVIAGLDPEVRIFDPAAALDGGADGLLFYRAIAAGFAALVPDGWLVLEIGYDQAETVRELLETARGGAAWSLPTVTRDLGGNPRCVAVRTRDIAAREKSL
jgi:release factor glutamine methyltransferase